MIRGLLGKKLGMTQIFDKDGDVVPVTVVEAGPCIVLGLQDSPPKVKVGFEQVKESRVNKPILGFFKKTGVPPLRVIKEFESTENKDYKVGQELKADVFKPGEFVNVVGTSIGKGFQGGMKRWHWQGGPRTHGSTSHRRVGSIGSTTTPGRVFKGHHMPGHMGARKTTLQNLKVIKTDLQNNIILVEGTVPGYKNCYVIIRKAVKVRVKKSELTKAASKEQGKK